MKRFVVPPNWPTPPRRSWVPPKTWRPDPDWPPAPAGWRFWVDGKGNTVRGPVGRYGGTSRRAVLTGAGGIALFLAINVWALSAIGLFDGEDKPPQLQVAPVLDDKSPTPTVTPPKVSPTVPKPSTPPPPTRTPTVKPTVKPTKTRTTRVPERTESRDPKPTRTTTTPTRPPVTPTWRPPTREDILREYCRQRGWDPDWCNPDNWPRNTSEPSTPPSGN
ncbi:hypothetical protein FB561_2548 [Kribbella amoyensis]|uniref:Uncharacterized protein n=1 Tax=Kribbella amoyensis TaxID=996641 RepID=A0A561BRN1_9ACTN|nr:hypothetical protein [Kribbella amoyensis]TWD81432.1 hypothetical protein FB561_2548 [Kribbella amoyensis]